LTIVSHDKYDEIVKLANNPTSLVRNVINLDTDSSFGRERQTLENTFVYDQSDTIENQSSHLAQYVTSGTIERSQAKEIIDDTIRCSKEVVKTMEHLHSSSQLTEQEHKDHITKQVVQQLANKHNPDTGIDESTMQQIVEEVTNNYVLNFAKQSIDIPKIYLDYAETSVSFDRNYVLNTDFLQ
jgi:type III restriction enzyme